MKASVSIITYNHEKFIAQAIDSVMMQKTDFDFEIIIGEDDSDDNTRTIVKEYKKRYPDKIILFLNERKNVICIDDRPTGRWNFVNNLKHAKGEYIAMLEGDDYWTDPTKLQKQVDFLDRNLEFSECFHRAGLLKEDIGKIIHWNYGPPVVKSHYTREDLFEFGNFIPTASTVFRNTEKLKLPDWYFTIPIGDFALHILNLLRGKIGFIDERMAVYRKHSGGIYGGNNDYNNFHSTLKSLKILKSNFNLSGNNSYQNYVSRIYCQLYQACRDKKKYIEAIWYGVRAIASATTENKVRITQNILQTLSPSLNRFNIKH